MKQSPSLEDAIALVAKAHEGQSEPFIFHPLRVMLRMNSPIERIVAVLHDVVEDKAYTLNDLECLGYSHEAVEALDY